MKLNCIRTEHILYVLILTLALSIRLVNLGITPLNDWESGLALQALDIAQGERGAVESNPGYVFLTGLTFSLLGSSNFVARLWPALVGGFLVLVPFFFRDYLGRFAALLLALGLALDPGLISLSRQAGGAILAVGFMLLALGLVAVHRPVPAGIFAGLALLSGPMVLHGILGLGLTGLVLLVLATARVFFPGERGGYRSFLLRRTLRAAALPFIGTLLVGGALFSVFPQGLGAWASALPDYLSGWVRPSGVPALRLLAGLIIYQPIALVFGLVGILQLWIKRHRDWEDDRRDWFGRFLSLWFLFALGLALLYPARQMADLAWALVPLWALAGIGLANLLADRVEQPSVSLAQAVLLFGLFVLVWLNLASLGHGLIDAQTYPVRLGLLGGVLALAGLSTLLVSLGWSWSIARRGLVWGLCLVFGLYGLAAAWRVSQFQPGGQIGAQELWVPASAIGQVDLFLETIRELSEQHTGRSDAIDIAVEVDSPSLRWALRSFPNTKFITGSDTLSKGVGLQFEEAPSIVITHEVADSLDLSSAYHGQDFVWWMVSDWEGVLPPDFYRWVVFRQAPRREDQIVLWARSDLFPGASLSSIEVLPQDPESNPVEDLLPVE